MEYFPGFTSIEILREIQKDLNARQINQDQFEGRIKFMRMFNDIDWTKSGNSSASISNAREVSDYAMEFQRGHWSFLGPADEEKWYGTCTYKPEGKWDQQANQMIEFTSHRVVIAYSEAQVRSAEERKSERNTIHFTADSGNIEFKMRTIHLANQLSVYGAVSSWCRDLSESMEGQVSTGVNMFSSEENEQLSQQQRSSTPRLAPRIVLKKCLA